MWVPALREENQCGWCVPLCSKGWAGSGEGMVRALVQQWLGIMGNLF